LDLEDLADAIEPASRSDARKRVVVPAAEVDLGFAAEGVVTRRPDSSWALRPQAQEANARGHGLAAKQARKLGGRPGRIAVHAEDAQERKTAPCGRTR
jgi:hypothetical protein